MKWMEEWVCYPENTNEVDETPFTEAMIEFLCGEQYHTGMRQ